MKKFYTVLALLTITGCTTTGRFKVPENSTLYIDQRPLPALVNKSGETIVEPFSWSASSGVPFRLEKDGKVIKEGKLRTIFRYESLLWPPAAPIYWPMGLDPDITYDLIHDKQE
jgi:hypothetical protein